MIWRGRVLHGVDPPGPSCVMTTEKSATSGDPHANTRPDPTTGPSPGVAPWPTPGCAIVAAGSTASLKPFALFRTTIRPCATVSVVLPLIDPRVALMVLFPRLTPWARPVVAPMVATEGFVDAQPTEPVRSAVVASE